MDHPGDIAGVQVQINPGSQEKYTDDSLKPFGAVGYFFEC
jgi:hypothetical protein